MKWDYLYSILFYFILFLFSMPFLLVSFDENIYQLKYFN